MNKKIYFRFFMVLVLLGLITCKDKEQTTTIPLVITESAHDITTNTAMVGGQVADDGNSQVTEYGVYWGTQPGVDTIGTKLLIGMGTGNFDTTLFNLISGTKYYIKAYAINSAGTSFGNETFFTTQILVPTLTTITPFDVTPNSARVGGNITSDGGYPIISKGIYWATQDSALINGTKILIASDTYEFDTLLTGLQEGVSYYIMAFASNVKGTTYADEIIFSTNATLPTVYTTSPYHLFPHAANLGGTVASEGGSTVTERGIYYGDQASPETSGIKVILGDGAGLFVDSIANLESGKKYYVKAYAINGIGTAYGEELSFTTKGAVPTVTTIQAIDLSTSGASLRGIVWSNDLGTDVSFEYGTTSSYGQTVQAIAQIDTLENDTITALISGLTPNVTYHFRIKATNELGTKLGKDTTFTTVLTGIESSVSDVDGNTYKTIGIGYQVWMTENLKTTKMNDGTAINQVNKDSLWQQLTTPGYCWYDTSITYKDIYGGLYNWQVVNTGKLCPSGWHVPTEDDFTEFINYLGGASLAGGLLKATGTTYWKSPNAGATDQFGFNGRGAGKRDDVGRFDFKGIDGNWWTSSEYSNLTSNYMYLMYNYPNAFQSYINKKYGLSVRCVKNE